MNVSGVESNFPITSSSERQPSSSHPVSQTQKRNISENSVLNDIASRYDIRKMSAPEMRRMAQELYDHNVIGLKELGVLTFMPMEAVQTEHGITYRPLSSNTLRFDYISNLEAALEFKKSLGSKGDEILEKTLAVLKKIEAAGDNHLNVRA